MNYATSETSRYAAAPVELFRFDYGLSSYCYTSADRDQPHQGQLYKAAPLSRGQVDQSQEDQAGSLEVSIPRESPVAALFIDYLPVTPVSLTVYRLHRGGTDTISLFRGTVTAATFSENECKLRCAANSDVTGRMIPIAVYQSQCNHVLFSTSRSYDLAGGNRAQSLGCNVSRDDHRATAAITAAQGVTLTVPALDSFPSGHFTYGYVERASGEVRWITAHNGDTITLNYPLRDLAPGERVSVFPGCDGSENTCRSKFNNTINFGGFTRLPQKNPFNSSIQ